MNFGDISNNGQTHAHAANQHKWRTLAVVTAASVTGDDDDDDVGGERYRRADSAKRSVTQPPSPQDHMAGRFKNGTGAVNKTGARCHQEARRGDHATRATGHR